MEIANIETINNPMASGEALALMAEFKLSLNAYLEELVTSPVRSLADVIAFNNKFSNLVSSDFGFELNTEKLFFDPLMLIDCSNKITGSG